METLISGKFVPLLVRNSAEAAVLVLVILLAQMVCGKRLTPRWRCALWLLVMIRLLLPVSVGSMASVFNLIPQFKSPLPVVAVPPLAMERPFAAAPQPTVTSLPISRSPIEQVRQNIVPASTQPSSAPVTQRGAQAAGESVAAPSIRKISWPLIAFILWLAGFLFMGIYLVTSSVRLRRRFSKIEPLTDDNLLDLLQQCREQLGVRGKLSLSESTEIATPALYGFVHPKLLLPRGFATRFSSKELRFILLHELAHVKRRDILFSWIATILQIIHWFNPLIWFGFGRWRADRELACDAMALETAGAGQNKDYGQTILRLLENFSHRSTLPGLVGILENKKQLQSRIRMIAGFRPGKKLGLASAAIFVGLGLVCLTDAQTKQTSGENTAKIVRPAQAPQDAPLDPEDGVTNGPDLTGVVTTANNQPVKATVLIYTAGPKIGTSSYCPSCYADCRKSATADSQGNFRIQSLDPELTFRILTVAGGYQPVFTEKVDPSKGPIKITLTPLAMASAPPGNCLHGRVVDEKGAPIVGAVIEAHGIRTYDGGGRWGGLDGVDPEAVSDKNGEFLITSAKPFDMMDVRVSARGFANNTFIKLPSGAESHTLVLNEGTEIAGRVLLHGKPLAGVEVGLVSVDRGMEKFTGNFTTGTTRNGEFFFLNIPTNVDYDLYGTMKSLAPYGCIPIQVVHGGNDGQKTDYGGLQVVPGYHLAGHVVLADGQPLPPKTRLHIGREQAWDSLSITLPSNGSFEVENLPGEAYSLSVRVPGYRVSAKNLSFDRLNPYNIVGRLEENLTNLTYLLEKGPQLASQFDSFSPSSEWPQNRPLHGVETHPDLSQFLAVTGHVTDKATGRPLADFQVTPGSENINWGQTHWDNSQTVEGTNGNYVVYVDTHFAQPALKVEASGYLPDSATIDALTQSNADFTLQKGDGPEGIVMLPNGKPASDVQVLLLSSESDQPYLRADDMLPDKERNGPQATTDSNGRFTLPPRLGMQSVVAASPDGFAQVPISVLATNSTITLEPYGEITGTLQRPNGPGTNEDLDVSFASLSGSSEPPINLNNAAHTDGSGHFHFKGVPPGSLSISYRMPVSENGWQNVHLQDVALSPGQNLALNINAAARQANTRQMGNPPPPPVRIAGKTITGMVVLTNGAPAANIEVGLQISGQFMQLGHAELNSYDAWQNGYAVHTDSGGRFSLPKYRDIQSIIAVGDAGFANVSLDDFKKTSQIILQPWGRIEGTLYSGHHPDTNAVINVQCASHVQNGDHAGLMPSLWYDLSAFQARTDEHGHFILADIPPGKQNIIRQVPIGARAWTSSSLDMVDVKPGQTVELQLGQNTRTVVGSIKLVGTNASPDWSIANGSISSASPLVEKFSRAKTPEERKALMSSPEYKNALENMRNFALAISPDGSFKAEDVQPGTYKIGLQFFRRGNMTPTSMLNLNYWQSTNNFVIPAARDDNDDKPVNIGTIELKSFSMQIPTNNVASK